MKKKHIKKILAASIISLFFVQIIYIFMVEPTMVSAVGASVTDVVNVTLEVTSGISIAPPPADVALLPIMGVGANSAIGSATWTVTTNHYSGYTLGVHASAAPALVNLTSNSFADFQATPIAWSLPANSYQFGFSAFGDHTETPTGTWGTGDSCGSAGAPVGTQKYRGFSGTTDIIVTTRTSVTPTIGMNTTVCFAAGQNGIFAPSGSYTAVITATATES